MQVSTQLDVDVVALEADDEVTVMLELVAPEAEEGRPRLPATIQVVLDRRGSMKGRRLAAAVDALHELVDRLQPDDRLGLVTFETSVHVPVPSGVIGDRMAAHAALARLSADGRTNLSGGLLRGMQEAGRTQGRDGATLLLISDGRANTGMTDPTMLADLGRAAAGQGITTSTVGVGLGYDETLLAAIATGGRGNHAFAEDSDDAAQAIAGEVQGLLDRTVQAATLTIRPEATVASVHLWNDLPAAEIDGALVSEIGDLWAGETRKLLVGFKVPAKAALGLARVATLEIRSVALPAMEEQTVTLEIHVNVVPGDQAAGRVPNPVVRTQVLVQQAAQAKREAAERLADGDVVTARAILGEAAQALEDAGLDAMEIDELRKLRMDAENDLRMAAKKALMQYHRQNRKPGRDGGSR